MSGVIPPFSYISSWLEGATFLDLRNVIIQTRVTERNSIYIIFIQ